MNDHRRKLNSLGVEIPSILLPQNVDMQKWPVIACDQFTQDRGYWEKVKAFTAGSPSTMNMIFPEVYLGDGGKRERINGIHSAMSCYLNDGVFTELKQGFIYIERDTPFQKKRKGLIAAIDLENYEWEPGLRPLIRCTEGTVPERLPPRMDIRRGAPLELPHVLVLIDDDKDSLFCTLAERAKKNAPIYTTPLMMESGRITGWFLDEQSAAFIAEKLDELCSRSVTRYKDEQPFLFAVGDGNHSLASAKGIWEEYKTSTGCKSTNSDNGLPYHPCRYALVEIENIYDPAIQFEPIHRLVFDIGFDDIISLLSNLPDFACRQIKDIKEFNHLNGNSTSNSFGISSQGRYALIETSAGGIATACLQPLLDNARPNGKTLDIDYIHDKEELFRLTAKEKSSAEGRQVTGILLPPVQKSGLFETAARLGPLPRKSFSMGHACEKRFYLECRKLY